MSQERISNQIIHIKQHVKLCMIFTHQFDHKASGGGGWSTQPDWPQLSTGCFREKWMRTRYQFNCVYYHRGFQFFFSFLFFLSKECTLDKIVHLPKSYDTSICHCISQTQNAAAHYGIHQVKHRGGKGSSSGCGRSWSLRREHQRHSVENKELNNKKEEILKQLFICLGGFIIVPDS